MVTSDHNMIDSEISEIGDEPALMKQTEQMINLSGLQQSVTKCVVCVLTVCYINTLQKVIV